MAVGILTGGGRLQGRSSIVCRVVGTLTSIGAAVGRGVRGSGIGMRGLRWRLRVFLRVV